VTAVTLPLMLIAGVCVVLPTPTVTLTDGGDTVIEGGGAVTVKETLIVCGRQGEPEEQLKVSVPL